MSRARRRTRSARLTASLAAAALLAGGAGVWALSGGAQAATGSADAQDDFNGDGYADLVVGAPDAKVSGKSRAGYVAVMYGSADGLSASRKKIISRSTSGIPGSATADQQFGASFTKGDLDGDGYSDLVIAGAEAGSVILWGSASGLTGGTNIAKYGAVPQIGDFDGDHTPDLALFSEQSVGGDDPEGAPATLWKGPVSRAGKPAAVLNILDKSEWWGWEEDDASCATGGGCEDGPDSITGPVKSGHVGDINGDGKDDIVQWAYTGDGTWGNRVLYGGGSGFTEDRAPGDTAGEDTGTGVGDVNGDGFDDVVVGTDGWNDKVRVAWGSSSGLSDENVQTFDQDLAGFPGAEEDGDQLGASVSVGDVTGDGCADIALGIPGEDVGSTSDAGSIALLRGSASGVTGTGAQTFHQNTSGVPGVAEKNDRFGESTALLDVDGNGHADLAAGSPPENGENGAAWVLRGTKTGLTATSAYAFGPKTVSAPYADAHFGAALR
ncbi:FG-GAP-like repeat-containing protein [Streptomyces sp. NPDC051776]|uniref:FG-GAP-like repeat-containing protein n=1 Tax=Streptomyces sp. NPDC051776 TaxID=3155414 RepID=UPI003431E896